VFGREAEQAHVQVEQKAWHVIIEAAPQRQHGRLCRIALICMYVAIACGLCDCFEDLGKGTVLVQV
jgi:hypothetical protein